MSESEMEKMAEITKRYRLLAGMTGEQFGAALVERMPSYKARSRQHISAWERGEQSVSSTFALAVFGTYFSGGPIEIQPWQAKWASEILDVYKGYQRPVIVQAMNLVEKGLLKLANVEQR